VTAISYFVVSRRLSLPARQSTAAIALLVASVWDGLSLAIMMAPGFGGAYCMNIPRIEEANKTWVATADKLPRSLRSVSPAQPCHHI